MQFTYFLRGATLIAAVLMSSVSFAGRAEIEQEISELKQYYADVVAKSGKMNEEAEEARQELIDAMFEYKQFTQALPYVRDSWAWIEQEGIGGKQKGRARFRLGKALRVAGYFDEALPYLKEACEKTVDKKGEGSKPAIKRCVQYGLSLANVGRLEDSIKVLETFREHSENVFGENHPRTAYANLQLGYSYSRVGRMEEAKKLLKDAFEIFEQKKGTQFKLTNLARFKLAKLMRATGEYDKAERILRKAYTDFASKEQNQQHQLAFHIISFLGRVLAEQGRYIEAEQLLKQGLEGKKRVMGEGSIKTIHSMISLAQLYLNQKKTEEASKVVDEIVRVGGGITKGSQAAIRRDVTVARVRLQSGQLEEAEKTFLIAKSAIEENGLLETPMSHAAHVGLGRTYFRQGQYDKAEETLLKAIQYSENTYGKYNPKTSLSKSYLAQNYVKKKDFDKAVDTYRDVMQSNAGFLAKQQTYSSSGRAQQEASAQKYLFSYMELMINAHEQGIKINANPVSESFAIAENSRSKTLQTAMLGQTARAAARNDYLSELVRREQDLRVRLGEVEDEQIEYVRSEFKGSGKQGKQLEEERRELTRELRKIGEEMSYQYPEYNRLVNPTATSLNEVKKLLAAGELMLAYFVQEDRTLIWAIDKDKATLHVSKLAEKDVLARVQRLRAGLDVPVATLDDIPSYNTKIAHELYKELVAPAGEQLKQAKHLVIVPHRALLSLPFGALITAQTNVSKGKMPFEGYKSVPWLAQKYAISIMPSATALVTMRTYAKVEKAEEPFIGFGDPLFGDRSDLPDGEVATRGIRVAQRAVINTRSIKGLPNLPETRDELKNIALTLGASEDNLFLGENANEGNVKAADLKKFKVVAFATHGLVAGDLDGLEQPALALTPPEQATEENDGLLQMGEVLGLELNADWVVLSACNTASGDKSLANEGLTGLTQAFFYAGSRALLVSLWPVESTSTQNLTTAMFAAAKKDTNLGRAASLQAARKRLIEGPGYMHEGKEVFSYAHPIFWSAFIAVGEGGIN